MGKHTEGEHLGFAFTQLFSTGRSRLRGEVSFFFKGILIFVEKMLGIYLAGHTI